MRLCCFNVADDFPQDERKGFEICKKAIYAQKGLCSDEKLIRWSMTPI